jgi:hypothetical protein
MSKRPRSEVKEQFWRQHLEAWRTSQQTVRAYCESTALSVPSFYAWRRELARRDGTAPEPRGRRGQTRTTAPRVSGGESPSSWVQLQAPSWSVSAAPIEIELAGGTVVRLRGDVNRRALTDVLAALTSAGSASSPQASSLEPEARSC